jgi:hypothetical protein
MSPRMARFVAAWCVQRSRAIIAGRREAESLRSVRWCVPLLITLVAGCAHAPASGPRRDEPAPTVARVQCGEDGTIEVLTQTVQAQKDGVHIHVDVPAGSNVGFSVRGCCGFNAEDAPFVVPIPPGTMPVGCLVGDQDPGDDSLYHEIRVVDEESAYISDELRCVGATGVGSGDAGPSAGEDPLTAARSLLRGLQPSDDIVHVGYVERQSAAAVAVRRDDEVIAVLRLEPSGRGWGWIGFESCPDSGIGY